MRRIGKNLTWMALACLALCMGLMFYTGLEQMRQNQVVVEASTENQQPMDPVTRFRTLRQQLRAMEKAQLNNVAYGAQTDEELSVMAQRQLLALTEREEQELTLEGVLEMRGFESPVVTVHEDSVNVLICTEMITQQESAAILELVCRETGVQGGNVKIIPIN